MVSAWSLVGGLLWVLVVRCGDLLEWSSQFGEVDGEEDGLLCAVVGAEDLDLLAGDDANSHIGCSLVIELVSMILSE